MGQWVRRGRKRVTSNTHEAERAEREARGSERAVSANVQALNMQKDVKKKTQEQR